MEEPTVYEIRVEGHLTERWRQWFEGLAIVPLPDGQTALRGVFVDQSALFGVLGKVQALNLRLVGVLRVECGV